MRNGLAKMKKKQIRGRKKIIGQKGRTNKEEGLRKWPGKRNKKKKR